MVEYFTGAFEPSEGLGITHPIVNSPTAPSPDCAVFTRSASVSSTEKVPSAMFCLMSVPCEKSTTIGPRMPGRPQWMWNMFTVARSTPCTCTSTQARLRSLLKRSCPCARCPAASRCARVSEAVVERNWVGVDWGVFCSSSPSCHGLRYDSYTVPISFPRLASSWAAGAGDEAGAVDAVDAESDAAVDVVAPSADFGGSPGAHATSITIASSDVRWVFITRVVERWGRRTAGGAALRGTLRLGYYTQRICEVKSLRGGRPTRVAAEMTAVSG